MIKFITERFKIIDFGGLCIVFGGSIVFEKKISHYESIDLGLSLEVRKVNIAICEDDKKESGRLISILEAELERQRVSARILSYESGEALVLATRHIKFEIYFLDVFMSGISGVAAARTIRSKDRNAAIVFTTSSPDYYADGFAVGAVHYLLKPFNKSDIYEALDRCLRQVGQAERYIELTVNREVCRILLSDLLWAESRDKVCELHLNSGNCHSYMQLNLLEEMLDDTRYLRCHRSYLVNLDYVSRMEKGCFIMSDGSEIPLRQAERGRLRTIYEDYLFEKMRRRR